MAAQDNSYPSDRELESKPAPSPSWTFTPPRSDLDLLDWMDAIARAIAADPPRYLHCAEQAEALTALTAHFRESFTAKFDPALRTITATQRKDAAREEARKAILNAMAFIKSHPDITLADKLALGMKLIEPRRAKGTITPPATAPHITILNAGDGTHTITFADEDNPHSKTRPPDADCLELRIVIAATICTDPDCLPEGAAIETARTKRNPHTIIYNRAHGGPPAMIATIFGRWCTRSGKGGPWGKPAWGTVAIFGRGE